MKTLLMVLFFLLPHNVMADGVCAAGEPSRFSWPVQNWRTNANNFWSNVIKPYHLGVDSMPSDAMVGTPVMAACSGVVREAQHHNGYGGTVIIECFTGTQCVSVLTGHLFTHDVRENDRHYRGLQVRAGQRVQRGALIGYIANRRHNGNVVPHVHLGIRKGAYNNVHSCDHTWAFAGYSGNSCTRDLWHNPDIFIPAHQGLYQVDHNNNPQTCASPPAGGEDSNWFYTCHDPSTVFRAGDTVYSLLRLDHVRQKHRFRVSAYRDGQFQWDWVGQWNQVASDHPWEHSFFWPTLRNAAPGYWEFKFDLDTGEGFPLEHGTLSTSNFSVLEDARPYIYHNTIIACRGPVSGGWHTDWYYTCEHPQEVFASGSTVTVFVRLQRVKHSHRYKVVAYKNDRYAWQWRAPWNNVEEVWQYSHFWPRMEDAQPGQWQFRIFIDYGLGYQPLDEVEFTVQP